MGQFWTVKILQVLSGGYIMLLTFTEFGTFGRHGGARDPETGYIIDPGSKEREDRGVVLWNGDERAVVASTTAQMILLGISRFSGFFMYPCLIMVFTTKLRATAAFLVQTPFSMFMYQDVHRLHVYCGWVILLDSCVHTACHLTRWGLQGNLASLVFGHASGISGFIVVLSMFLIVMPMVAWKRKVKYEIRKALHYLFLVFGVAMCFHAPTSAVPNGGFCGYVFTILLIWYFLDALYCALFMTELIQTTVYHTLESSGVQMTLNVSKRFQSWGLAGGFGYVCFPWIDRTQWHAFSLFENPSSPQERQMFIQKTGDWTSKVHQLLLRESYRPVWIQGPFPTPFTHNVNYDNQILVASGIGITPSLSVIRAHSSTRRINLIWAVRDPAMLQFFLERAYLDHNGWNLIFYTGKQPLLQNLVDEIQSTNVCLVTKRPDFNKVIPNIIYGIETKIGLPERYVLNQKLKAIQLLHERLQELDDVKDWTPKEKVANLQEFAAELGYNFSDIATALGSKSESSEISLDCDVAVNGTGQRKDEREPLINGSQSVAVGSPEQFYDDVEMGTNVSSRSRHDADSSAPPPAHPRHTKKKIGDEDILGKFRKFDIEKERGILEDAPYDRSGLLKRQPSEGLFAAKPDKRETPTAAAAAAATTTTTMSPLPSSERLNFHDVPLQDAPGVGGTHQTSEMLSISGHTAVSKMNTALQPELATHDKRAALAKAMSQRISSFNTQMSNLICEEMSIRFRPWEDIDEAQEFVRGLDKRTVLSTWGILYCGGSAPVKKALKGIAKDYGIDLHTESFAW